MWRVLIPGLLLMVFSFRVSVAQGGDVMLYSVPGLDSCEFPSDEATYTVYVVHEGHPGATAIQYMISKCNSNLVFLSENVPWPAVLGSADTGIAVSYGACEHGYILVQTVTYGGGPPSLDSGLAVVPDPNATTGQIEGVNCASSKTFPTGWQSCFGCANVRCGPYVLGSEDRRPSYECTEPVPVSTSTWGHIKHLYQ